MSPRLNSLAKFISILLGAFAGALLLYYYVLIDWKARPFCHKQVFGSFQTWMSDRKSKDFPNVEGSSSRSLAQIQEEMGGYMGWASNYNYVPGLREDDPGDLVLMYVSSPTRWIWHGPPRTILSEKGWIVVPVDFTMGTRARSGPGELSERVPVFEFKTRLQRTLDFIRTNDRPHWQAVVAEHEAFLNRVASPSTARSNGP